MELWKKSEAPAGAGGQVVVTGGVRVAGAGAGGEKAVARVAASAPASPGAAGVRKASAPAARPPGEGAATAVEIRPESALPSVVRAAQGAAPSGGARAASAPVATSASASTSTTATAPAARVEAGPSAAPPPASTRGGTNSLLPPRAAGATATAAASAATATAPANRIAADAFDLFGDDEGPILVVESLPPTETLFDRTPVPFQERTFLVRYDSAGVAGIVCLLLLSCMFMLGRTSATNVAEAQSPPAKIAEAPKLPVEPREAPPPAPEPRQARETGFEQEVDGGVDGGAPAGPSTAASTAASTGAQGPAQGSTAASSQASTSAESGAPGGRTGTSSAAATSGPEFGIMAVGGIPRKNAEAVAAFMGKQGFQARIVGSGNRCGVIVGSYPEKKGPAIEADLEKVRALRYVDGQKPFAYAYAYPLKK